MSTVYITSAAAIVVEQCYDTLRRFICLFLSPCRCVTEDQRTLALGLQSCLWRVFGSVPGPILFGVLFDSACLFWQRDCGRRGNCWVYDNSVLSTRVMVLAVGAIVGYIFFVFLCWWLYPHQPTTEQEERIPLTEKHNSQ